MQNIKYSDVEAFKIGAERYSSKEKIKIAFLKAGYMDITNEELTKYINIYYRGLKEVKELIKK